MTPARLLFLFGIFAAIFALVNAQSTASDSCKSWETPDPDIFGIGTRSSLYIQYFTLIFTYHLFGREGQDWEGVSFGMLSFGIGVSFATLYKHFLKPEEPASPHPVQLLLGGGMSLLVGIFSFVHYFAVPVRPVTRWWHFPLTLALMVFSMVMGLQVFRATGLDSTCVNQNGLRLTGMVLAFFAACFATFYAFFFLVRVLGYYGKTKLSLKEYWCCLNSKKSPVITWFFWTMGNPLSTFLLQLLFGVVYVIFVEGIANSRGWKWEDQQWDFGQFLAIITTCLACVQLIINLVSEVSAELRDEEAGSKSVKRRAVLFPDVHNWRSPEFYGAFGK